MSRKRKVIHWLTFGATLMLIGRLCYPAACHDLRHLHLWDPEAWIRWSPLVVWAPVLAAGAAGLVCRLLRVSLALRSTEVLRERSMARPLALPPQTVQTGVAEFGPQGVCLWPSWRRIPWVDIVRFEVRTEKDALGRTKSVECLIFERGRKRPRLVALTSLPEEKRRQLLDAIRGEPAPAELIAAEAPAGRGTELAAAAEGPALPVPGGAPQASRPSRVDAGCIGAHHPSRSR